MADNSGSNIVAIFAIVIIVLVAAAGFYYFVNQGMLNSNPGAKVEVNLPAPSKASE